MSPELSEFVSIRDTIKELYCPEIGTLYKALSAEASTAYGLSPVFIVHDELGQVKGPRSELYDALETAVGAHDRSAVDHHLDAGTYRHRICSRS